MEFALISQLNIQIVREFSKPPHSDVRLSSRPKQKPQKKKSKNLKLKTKRQPLI